MSAAGPISRHSLARVLDLGLRCPGTEAVLRRHAAAPKPSVVLTALDDDRVAVEALHWRARLSIKGSRHARAEARLRYAVNARPSRRRKPQYQDGSRPPGSAKRDRGEGSFSPT